MRNTFKSTSCCLSVALACIAFGEAHASPAASPTESQQRAAYNAAAFLSGFARATKTTLIDSGAKLHLLKSTNQQSGQLQPQQKQTSVMNNDIGRAPFRRMRGELPRFDVLDPFGFHPSSHTLSSAGTKANLPYVPIDALSSDHIKVPAVVEPVLPSPLQDFSAPPPRPALSPEPAELRPEIR